MKKPVKPIVQVRIVKNEWDEYEVQWIENGKKKEARTYYTDDKEDAQETAKAMRKEALR